MRPRLQHILWGPFWDLTFLVNLFLFASSFIYVFVFVFVFLLIYCNECSGESHICGSRISLSIMQDVGKRTQVSRLGSRHHWAILLAFPGLSSLATPIPPFSPALFFSPRSALFCGQLLSNFYLPASMRRWDIPAMMARISVCIVHCWPSNCNLTHSRALSILAPPEHIKGQLAGLAKHTFIRSQSHLFLWSWLTDPLFLPSFVLGWSCAVRRQFVGSLLETDPGIWHTFTTF